MRLNKGDTSGGLPPPPIGFRGWYNPPPLATNQTIIPYPKPLKHSNKTKLSLNESKNNSLDIFSAKDNIFYLN